ncbi:MAG: hypothetical protein JWN52_8097 [Actinomycetia bacterium]|nr:hypothetical protein [Actinomycetes bacterium]
MTAASRPKVIKDDQPFDFNLDAVVSEIDLSPFRVHFGGRRWEFRHMQDLDVWELVAEAEGGDMGQITQMFKVGLGDGQLAEFRKIPLPQHKMKELFDAWQKFSGLQPGESEASTDS